MSQSFDGTETHHNHACGYSYPINKSRLDFEPSHRFGVCPQCSTDQRPVYVHWKQVNGRYSEKHICDSRCLNATGPNCECSCGGANHGGSHLCPLSPFCVIEHLAHLLLGFQPIPFGIEHRRGTDAGFFGDDLGCSDSRRIILSFRGLCPAH